MMPGPPPHPPETWVSVHPIAPEQSLSVRHRSGGGFVPFLHIPPSEPPADVAPLVVLVEVAPPPVEVAEVESPAVDPLPDAEDPPLAPPLPEPPVEVVEAPPVVVDPPLAVVAPVVAVVPSDRSVEVASPEDPQPSSAKTKVKDSDEDRVRALIAIRWRRGSSMGAPISIACAKSILLRGGCVHATGPLWVSDRRRYDRHVVVGTGARCSLCE
jgi:hypothetical protein